jgi:formate acetyltransferase 1
MTELGVRDEVRAQELVDDLAIKLRIVRFLRTPEYDELFSGDPTWVTEAIGGMGADGRPLVTRTSYRYLQTLYNLGPAPEPNLTVLWSPSLPAPFKRFCAKVSIETSSVQYENDDLRARLGDDAAIACCVSAMEVGRRMQFFGARVNLAKALLYAINGGRDELTGEQVAPASVHPPLTGEHLDYAAVRAAFDAMLDWLAATYVDALNIIHYMHDKYAYERIEMALHDYPVARALACGIAGLSVAAAASRSAAASRCCSPRSPGSCCAAPARWACTPPSTPPAISAGGRRAARRHRSGAARHQGVGAPDVPPRDRRGGRADAAVRPAARHARPPGVGAVRARPRPHRR